MDLLNFKLPFRILGVDPATTISAWTVTEIQSLNPLVTRILDYAQIDGQKLLKEKKSMTKLFTKQFCVVDALEDEYSKVIEKWKPDAVVSEGAYVGIHVSAAIAINLAIHALRRSTYHGIGIDIFVVPPSISKLAFAGRGGADKDAMRLAYTKATYILDKPDEKELSEHIIDSFAHAIGWLSRDVLGTVIQISAQEKRQAKREKEKRKLERESA